MNNFSTAVLPFPFEHPTVRVIGFDFHIHLKSLGATSSLINTRFFFDHCLIVSQN